MKKIRRGYAARRFPRNPLGPPDLVTLGMRIVGASRIIRVWRPVARRYSDWNLHQARVLKLEPLKDPKWVQANRISYINPRGQESVWESCSRKTRVQNGKGQISDAVAVIAIMNIGENPRIVLQKQFRPPIDGVCIEMPAGLLDEHESVQECATRELFEETGYKGQVKTVSPPIYNDMGFASNNVTLVTVEIDPNNPDNQTPVPHLEPNECIETFTLPLENLKSSLDDLQAQGYFLCARLYHVATGLEIGRGLAG